MKDIIFEMNDGANNKMTFNWDEFVCFFDGGTPRPSK